jgi:hypothetical protein
MAGKLQKNRIFPLSLSCILFALRCNYGISLFCQCTNAAPNYFHHHLFAEMTAPYGSSYCRLFTRLIRLIRPLRNFLLK